MVYGSDGRTEEFLPAILDGTVEIRDRLPVGAIPRK